MEKENKGLLKKLWIVPIVVAGSIAISPKQTQIKETTSIYQGYNSSDGDTYLVFDDKPKREREGFPELVIKGNPDTLKIGREYTIKYSVKNGRYSLPQKIKEIKYSENSD